MPQWQHTFISRWKRELLLLSLLNYPTTKSILSKQVPSQPGLFRKYLDSPGQVAECAVVSNFMLLVKRCFNASDKVMLHWVHEQNPVPGTYGQSSKAPVGSWPWFLFMVRLRTWLGATDVLYIFLLVWRPRCSMGFSVLLVLEQAANKAQGLSLLLFWPYYDWLQRYMERLVSPP